MTKEDFVDELFMSGINISLFALPHKELLVSIGENEEMRQAALKHLKDICSNMTFLLNGLRSEDDFDRYSKAYEISRERWFSFLKGQGEKVDEKKLEQYKKTVQTLISFIEKGK